ncbi:MAG: hypothetical protein ACF8R7_09555 [Phycisphaerales bacterium JB039]
MIASGMDQCSFMQHPDIERWWPTSGYQVQRRAAHAHESVSTRFRHLTGGMPMNMFQRLMPHIAVRIAQMVKLLDIDTGSSQ